jgi:hypothetical protein
MDDPGHDCREQPVPRLIVAHVLVGLVRGFVSARDGADVPPSAGYLSEGYLALVRKTRPVLPIRLFMLIRCTALQLLASGHNRR